MSNDDRVAAGGGFGTHSHRDMEIVTWVLSGRLLHEDSEGNHGDLYPGLAQRMSAGTGIAHSERNGSATEPVHFVQMWVPPDTAGIRPGYEQRDVNDTLLPEACTPSLAARATTAPSRIHQRDAVLLGRRLAAGEGAWPCPTPPFVHLRVRRRLAPTSDGAARLAEADAARLTDAGTLTGRRPHRRRGPPLGRRPGRRSPGRSSTARQIEGR